MVDMLAAFKAAWMAARRRGAEPTPRNSAWAASSTVIPVVVAPDLTQFLFALDETDIFPGDCRTGNGLSILERWRAV